MTRQRAAILRALQATDQHPTAERLHAQVRQDLPQISLATVYRLLNALSEEGAINILDFGNGPKRFDGDTATHHHVICIACGRIDDVPELVTDGARGEIERWTGYAVSRLRLDWQGICPDCRPAGTAP